MQARSHKAFNGGNTSSCGVGQRPAFRPCCFLRGPAACVARCAACFAGRAFFRAGAWVRMRIVFAGWRAAFTAGLPVLRPCAPPCCAWGFRVLFSLKERASGPFCPLAACPPLFLQPVRASAHIHAGGYPAKHIPAARSGVTAPRLCSSQQPISGAFFRGGLFRTTHSILRRLQQLLFSLLSGGQQAFLCQLFRGMTKRSGQLCPVMTFSCLDVLQRLPS